MNGTIIRWIDTFSDMLLNILFFKFFKLKSNAFYVGLLHLTSAFQCRKYSTLVFLHLQSYGTNMVRKLNSFIFYFNLVLIFE